jgi:hypothetical protein
MNTSEKSFASLQFIQTCALAFVLCWAVGCRSTGYQKGEIAGRGLQNASAEVETETRHIEATLAALKDLVEAPGADLKPQFRRFSKSLDRLIDSAEKTDKTGKRVELKNAKYFSAWDKEMADIHYGIVRERSEARKSEVTNQLHAVNLRYQELQAVVWPLITYFNDIRAALRADLTAGGLDSVKPIVSNADQNARKVQTSLAKLSNELTDCGTSLSAVGGRTTVRPQETVRAQESEPEVSVSPE